MTDSNDKAEVKVGLLLFQNMRNAPFLKTYEDFIENTEGCTFKTLYLDRNMALGEQEDEKHTKVKWSGKVESKVCKVLNSIKYYFAAKKFIKKNKFDFIIALTTLPAVLMSGFLKKYYNGRYIVDIRDYTQEHFNYFYNKEKEVLSNSALNVISSPGFEKFLPDGEYNVFHNYNTHIGTDKDFEFTRAESRRIIISNIGGISYAKQWKELINLVNCDERFEIRFYGGNKYKGEVQEYVNELNNPRITLMGPFKPAEKKDIYLKSDIVFNCYGNSSKLVKYAISNRFYDGAYYKKPLIVSPDTIMEDVSEGFAYSLDLGNISHLDDLYEWYMNLDKDEYEKFTKETLQKSYEENAIAKSKIKEVILNS